MVKYGGRGWVRNVVRLSYGLTRWHAISKIILIRTPNRVCRKGDLFADNYFVNFLKVLQSQLSVDSHVNKRVMRRDHVPTT